MAEPTLEVIATPFVRAYQEDAGKQLIGQISGAVISLGTLASEKLYYVLSGEDFTMEEFANISWHNAGKFLSICRSYLVKCYAGHPGCQPTYHALWRKAG